MICRDQFPCPWDQLTAAPLKTLLVKLPRLQRCDIGDCPGTCEMWHSTEGCDVDDPALETWSKQWLNDKFGFVPAHQSTIFSTHMRVPARVQTQLQMYSGLEGIYILSHGHWKVVLPPNTFK